MRHVAVAVATVALVAFFQGLLPGFEAERRWNPALGRASVLLLAATLALGPAARFWPRLRGLLPVRRELGVWSVLAAVAHVVLVMDEWAGWRLASLWTRFAGEAYVVDGGRALANLLGALALAYGVVLLVTSNDASMRRLGPRWAALHRAAATLFLLAVLHTAYFAYIGGFRGGGPLHIVGGFRGGAADVVFRVGLAVAVVVVVVLRTLAFWWPKRVPASRTSGASGASGAPDTSRPRAGPDQQRP